MKGLVSIVAVLTLAGAAFAQQTQVYTPAASDPSVPTLLNGEVVRVDPSGRTITVRAEGRDTVLVVEGEGLKGLSTVRPGDQVMLGYHADNRDGRLTRIVTNIRTVTPAAPAPGTAPTTSRSTTIESVRVVAVNPSKRTLTIDDGAGARHVVSVTNDAAKNLRQIRAGDDVVLSYRSGKGRTRTVIRIEPVGVSTRGAVRQVGGVSPVAETTITTTTTTTAPVIVAQTRTPATGGMPLPSNTPGAPALLQPVPNVGPPTSPTLNVALPPATAGTVPDTATAAQAEAIRAQSVRDFQAATVVLALKANEIDGLWFAFKDQCLGGTTPSGAASTTGREWFVLLDGNTIQQPGDDACRRRLADLQRAAELFQQQLGPALDGARKADLAPGTIRDVLQRNRLDR
jgi:hypothetical protein